MHLHSFSQNHTLKDILPISAQLLRFPIIAMLKEIDCQVHHRLGVSPYAGTIGLVNLIIPLEPILILHVKTDMVDHHQGNLHWVQLRIAPVGLNIQTVIDLLPRHHHTGLCRPEEIRCHAKIITDLFLPQLSLVDET